MPQTDLEFNILFRKPKYPLIVISNTAIMAAYNIRELAVCCISAIPAEKEGGIVKAIDSTGEEFWFSPETCTITPGFAFRRWTKKQIIELYENSTSVSKDTKHTFRSLSNKKLSDIIAEICDLIKT